MDKKISELQSQIEAKDKTINTLLKKAWQANNASDSAYNLLDKNVHLQQALDKRTAELSAKTTELENALNELAQHQAELLQTQKLESVGRLAAGVAHEINTPIQFVSDSVYFLSDGISDILNIYTFVRNELETICGETNHVEAMQRVADAEEAHDYDYLSEQFPHAIDRCISGLTRVALIVSSMKEFAHPGSDEFVLSDINHMIETATTIAAHEYKYCAELNLNLGEVPVIPCLKGELNQVLLNLLVNASHAVADKVGGTGNMGEICVTTRHDEDFVHIDIADSGLGIPDEIQTKVFDPFFTTKSEGKGTGQGLAMARNVIVTKHQGELNFKSETNVGTTFTISLPIKRSSLSEEAA